MSFVDEITVYVKSGDGGDGCVSFRREKFVPKGGPNGGDGGRGGNIYIVTDGNLSSLMDLKYKHRFNAQRGRHGMGKNCHGRAGSDITIRVPVGTVVTDAESGDVIADLVKIDEKLLVAQGGRGGKGNARFATSTNQAPRYAEPGEPGEEKKIRLELKLLADVGIIGLPNAGKSTLISRISASHSKVAPYPFTTLSPHLGVVNFHDFRSFVVADIPGLIKGAHKGVGLGLKFLRHIERTNLLLHIIDASADIPDAPLKDFETIQEELKAYGHGLTEKKQIVVLNKIDILGKNKDRLSDACRLFDDIGADVCAVSALTGEGIDGLIERVGDNLLKEKESV